MGIFMLLLILEVLVMKKEEKLTPEQEKEIKDFVDKFATENKELWDALGDD